jgi:hypothetical protein
LCLFPFFIAPPPVIPHRSSHLPPASLWHFNPRSDFQFAFVSETEKTALEPLCPNRKLLQMCFAREAGDASTGT